MTPTHAISADEARRLLREDREKQRRLQKAMRGPSPWIPFVGFALGTLIAQFIIRTLS